MTTALALWLIFSLAIAAYVGLAGVAIAAGARAWWFLAAAPVLVAFVPLAVASFHCTLAWIFRVSRPPGHRIGMAAGVRLLVDCPVEPGSSIQIDLGASVLMGEVRYCQAEGQQFGLGIELEKPVNSAGDLTRILR